MARRAKTPLEKYDDAVNANIDLLNSKLPNQENNAEKYRDPDLHSGRTVEIDGMQIYLSQDGLCSLERIMEFAEENEIVSDYELIRKGMFDVLVWPGYAQSINQMRSAKYEDRLDLLFIDLYKFFKETENDPTLTKDVVNKVWNNCDLARAYLYPNTFYWLKHFGSFKRFVDERKLENFANIIEGKPQIWTKDDGGVGFTKEYYDELIERVDKYRNEPETNT